MTLVPVVVSLVKVEQGTNMRMSQIIARYCPVIRQASWPARTSPARWPRAAAAAVLAMPDQHLATRLSNVCNRP